MAEPEEPRRPTPGGAVPRRLRRREARARPPGEERPFADRPLGVRRGAWHDLDEQDLEAERARRAVFEPLIRHGEEQRVRTGRGPSLAVVVGILVILAVVALAVLLYQRAPAR